jgi:uncharacterized protein (TIGR02145 family)
MQDFEIQTFIDDRDRMEYQAIKVGKLLIMSQNLACTTFRNGDPIPVAKDALQWEKAGGESKAMMCHYAYDSSLNSVIGRFYNEYALKDPRGVAPENWRIPSLSDIRYVIEYMLKANCKLSNNIKVHYIDDMSYETIAEDEGSRYPRKIGLGKVLGATLNCSEIGLKEEYPAEEWNENVNIHQNPFHFSALPVGYCDNKGIFHEFGISSVWVTESNNGEYYPYRIRANKLGLSFYTFSEPDFGFTVRCVRDI